MLTFLSAGLLLGLSGGLAPGPLLTLVASETLRHGAAAGVRVALAPLLTDAPIVLATLLVLQPLADQPMPLALLHLGGGLYLGWLAFEGLRFQGADLSSAPPSGSLWRGVIANFLNPSPYLFWLTVGAPTVLAAWQESRLAMVVFIAAFYTLLVGSKVLLALGLGRSRRTLRSRGYRIVMRGLGGLLLVYALLFLYQGGRLLASPPV
jgi:threonine/homoserine/homoserine lactone efflux protein